MNLNNKCRVYLTPFGETVLKRNKPSLYKNSFNAKIKSLECTTKEIMSVFGEAINKSPFVDDLIFFVK